MNNENTIPGDHAETGPSGMDRRDFVKKAAVAGALAWTVPSLTSASAAFATAAGSEFSTPVDTFTTEQVLTVTTAAPVMVSQVEANALGGFRDAYLAMKPPPIGTSPLGQTSVLTISNGLLTLNQTNAASSTVVLTYDGSVPGVGVIPIGLPNMGLNENLTADGSNAFCVHTSLSTSTVVPLTVTVTVWSVGSVNQSVTLVEPTIGPDLSLSYRAPFSDFGDVDFAQVAAVRLEIEVPSGLNLMSLGFLTCGSGA